MSAISDDEALEQRILTAAVKCSLAKTQEEHTPLWKELTALIAQRSAEQVARMEKRMGLA